MGLLDDAIREHLELKRRHGASDEEIAQEEAEALGPARRDFPVPADAGAEVQGTEVQGTEDEGAVDDALPEAIEDMPTAAEPPPPEPSEAEPEPTPEPDPELETGNWELGTETEQDPEDHDQKKSDEDVLEETPEFLQDAPEHDRLWFEQKPPRDFDFE